MGDGILRVANPRRLSFRDISPGARFDRYVYRRRSKPQICAGNGHLPTQSIEPQQILEGENDDASRMVGQGYFALSRAAWRFAQAATTARQPDRYLVSELCEWRTSIPFENKSGSQIDVH
jgi:hypothetical protein